MIATRRQHSFLLPALLIVGGGLLLLANLGALPEGAGWRLLELWPLILVVIGVQIVVSRTAQGTAATAIALVAIGLVAIGAFTYAVAGPAIGAGSYSHFNSSSPAAGIDAGRITIDAAGSRVVITTADTGSQLYVAAVDYTGAAPKFSYAGGDVHITSGRGSGLIVGGRQDVYTLTISNAVPWSVVINGAGITAQLDFTTGRLGSFDLNGVGSNVKLSLGSPVGNVPIAAAGVGTEMTVTVPAGSQYRATADGLGTEVTGLRETQGWAAASDRYDLSASGVGTHLTVREAG